MKKLSELSKDEVVKLCENNEGFKEVCWNNAYENSMYWQQHEFEELGAKVFNYSDHYNTFYLSTPMFYGGKAPEQVAGELNKDYMNPENAKLYTKLCKLNDKYENMDYDEQKSEQGEKLYDEMIEVCDELANGITEQLRAFENINDEQVIEELEFQRTDGYMADWETDGEKVYQTITKVYE